MALIFKTVVSVITLAMMGLLIPVGMQSEKSGKVISGALILIYALCILAIWV
jgi:hypothetical protein